MWRGRFAPPGIKGLPRVGGSRAAFARRRGGRAGFISVRRLAAANLRAGGRASSSGNKKAPLVRGFFAGVQTARVYISMPPPGIGGIGASFFGSSTTQASVVSTREAMEAAFCRAERVTLVGSSTPSFIISPNLPVAAL